MLCGCGAICADAFSRPQVTDTKPKRPSWGLMSSSSEGVATAIAAWGHFVIMGDTEGSLNRWDTQTGRISTVQTTQVCQHTFLYPYGAVPQSSSQAVPTRSPMDGTQPAFLQCISTALSIKAYIGCSDRASRCSDQGGFFCVLSMTYHITRA